MSPKLPFAIAMFTPANSTKAGIVSFQIIVLKPQIWTVNHLNWSLLDCLLRSLGVIYEAIELGSFYHAICWSTRTASLEMTCGKEVPVLLISSTKLESSKIGTLPHSFSGFTAPRKSTKLLPHGTSEAAISTKLEISKAGTSPYGISSSCRPAYC